MVLIRTDLKKITSLQRWMDSSNHLHYAYQPIVNIHTGLTLGFEALLRGYNEAGFKSINDVFNSAYEETVLYSLDLHLRELAIKNFYQKKEFSDLKLFYNLDNRVLEMPDYLSGNTEKFLKANGMHSTNICFEISEKHEFANYQNTHRILRDYKDQNYRIAIDDFGSGYSGLTLLYHSEPDFIKIDRFFIENINDDSRKKFFVANVVNLAHMMGISVIAEGIETIGEFYVCREIGCDYIQGYLIQRPESNPGKLLLRYPLVEELVNSQSRKTDGDKNLIKREMKEVPSVSEKVSTEEILERFRKGQGTQCCFPVVNTSYEPLGLLRESDLKKYVYSPYGISILQHQSATNGIESLIFRAPVMEIYNPIEKILELYSLNEDLDGVIITENGKYRGILDSSAILRILSEKKISIAQDQNPLTKLPGNTSINNYLSGIIREEVGFHICVYFDFDNFKPFNDTYGFRQGDRIIRLFADILLEHRIVRKNFTGHIGGDDFFIGYSGRSNNREDILLEIKSIIDQFEADVLPFYTKEHREQGYITAQNRHGGDAKFPLLSVSAAVICIISSVGEHSIDKLTETIASLKQKAKNSKDHMAFLDI
ncbi:MAG: EAL domain-containing protein [Spirochaetales bacterium]|nr:EAL domain-containing protein [Spirochaetales bacterium]